jgi:glycosyltransferase involved in cell wall biosynthesis
MTVKNIAVVSYRLNGADGVSVESAKWCNVLSDLGYRTYLIAGEGADLDYCIPELSITSLCAPDLLELRKLFNKFDLIIAENICSLPLNAKIFDVTNEALKNKPVIMHHHDLPWQRPGYSQSIYDAPNWQHVVINQLSRDQLYQRGIRSHLIYNAFSPPNFRNNRNFIRDCLRVSPATKLGVQPTRAIARKNIPKAIDISRALNSFYWLLGRAEDGYQKSLSSALAAAKKNGLKYHHGLAKFLLGKYVWDAYEACDFILFPSSWEGFGNPAIESALCKRPLLIGNYPVAKEIESFGFRFFHTNEVDDLGSFLKAPEEGLLDNNHKIALEYFGINRLKAQLSELIKLF